MVDYKAILDTLRYLRNLHEADTYDTGSVFLEWWLEDRQDTRVVSQMC